MTRRGRRRYARPAASRLIGRNGYDIAAYRLDANGACQSCGTKLAGVFAAKPGNWGAKRQPVDIERFAA